MHACRSTLEDPTPDENKADAVYPKLFAELLAEQSPVKSQGSRGVCSIFATAALMENLYIKEGSLPNPDFSEQYLQWSAKAQVGSFTNTEGSNADSNLRAINRYGIVLEQDWAYESRPWNATNDPACTGGENLPTRCYTNGEPPASAVDATKWFLPVGRWLGTRNIKAHLTTKRHGVVVGMTFFYQSWNHRASTLPVNNEYWRRGIVLYPNAVDKQKSLEKRAGHAVLIVGWDDDLEVPVVDETGAIVTDANGNQVTEKGFYIFKNSWGTTSFGIENPHGAGYGYLSMRYVDEYASAYVSDVPRLTLPTEICDDGLDNDFDAAVDCDDTQCAEAPVCTGSTAITYAAEIPAPVAIPDNNPTGVSSTITVPAEQTATIGELKVTVDIGHTYRGDLRVTLYRGDVATVLHNRTGGYEDNLKQTFAVPSAAGQPLAGDWRLVVVDTAGQDVGTLNAWSIEAIAQ